MIREQSDVTAQFLLKVESVGGLGSTKPTFSLLAWLQDGTWTVSSCTLTGNRSLPLHLPFS